MKPVFFNSLGHPVFDAHNPEGATKLHVDRSEQFTMVEFVNDYGEWRWWDILRDITPEKAIAHYLAEMDLEPEETHWSNGECYAEHTDVRAYYITI